MRAVSDAFLRTLRGSHAMVAQAIVCSTWQTGTDPDGVEIDIGAGQVVEDATADIRGTLDLTTNGVGLFPSRRDSVLAPYGNEIFVRRGILYGNGVTEWCSLGYYRIQSPSQDDAPDGEIKITGKDRMAGIIDGRPVAVRQYDPSATYGQVMAELVTEVYPAATIEWDDATDVGTIGRAIILEDNRYGLLNDMVASLGKIWYWDYRGILVIRDAPDESTQPAWDVNAGEDGVLVKASRSLTRDRVYNAVVASGESTNDEPPVRGVAVDGNPDSPTYFYGRFGPVPEYYTSQFLTTSGQATQAASSMLRTKLGLPYNMGLDAVPNPALEPYDVVRVDYGSQTGPENHLLQSVTVPLVEDATLTATTREQTSVLIGTP
jgi:hypothetical protein